MLLMKGKCIGGGISLYLLICKLANNKYIKDYDKNKEMWYLQYSDVNNLYGWALSQKLPVNKFEWVKDTSQLDEDFIKTIVRKKVMKVMKNWRKVDV